MTTLIDDGLVESNLETPISHIDFEEFSIIDIDNIDATIEDPGYILDEDTLNRNEEYTSSYKKGSYVLPVTFFDISRNITLLKKCRPISIKVVDCVIYPWYYKKIKHAIENNDVNSNQGEDLQQYNQNDDTTSRTSLSFFDTFVLDSVSPPPTFVGCLPEINLSSEQKSAVLKLKEDINNQLYVNETNVVKNEKALNIQEDLPPFNKKPECSIDKYVKPEDMLSYKAIAQTIIRNIDHNDVNVETNYRNMNINETNDNRNVEKLDTSKPGQTTKEREKIPTSPILPYSIKPKKNSKSKILAHSPKRNINIQKCNDSMKEYDKCVPCTSQVIPHYHGSLPVSLKPNNHFHFTNVGVNHIPSERPVTRPLYQLFDKNNILYQKDSISSNITQRSIVSSPSSIEYRSNLGFHQAVCDNTLINNCQVTKEQFTENSNSNINTSINCQFYNPNSLYYQNRNHASVKSRYQSTIELKKDNSQAFVRCASAKKTSQNEFRVFTQTSSALNNSIPNSMCLLNKYVNCRRKLGPLQNNISNNGNLIQRNPLLSQLLNRNTFNYHQSELEHQGQIGYRAVTGRISHSLIARNYLLPPTPKSPCAHYLPSTEFSQDTNFEHLNAAMQLQNFANSENSDSLQYKTNVNIKHLETNQRELTKGHKNHNNVSMYAPNVTISEIPSYNFGNRKVYAHTDIQNQISPESYEFTNPEYSINMNANIDNQNIFNVVTKECEIKTFDTNMLYDMKSKCIYSEVHHCNITNQNEKVVSKKNTSKSLKQPKLFVTYESGKVSVIDSELMRHRPTLSTEKDNIARTKPVQTRINGYSPPILPIPSFEESLEMLSGLRHSPTLNKTPNNLKTHNTRDISEQKSKVLEFTNITRKRKLHDNEDNYQTMCKRISLQE